MKKPKILFYDIETTPNLGYIWGKYQQDVIAYAKERELLCFAYKWLGDKSVKCVTNYYSAKGDKSVVEALAKLLNQADIVVAHNGDEFDRKIVKSRMLYWKLPPLKINSSVDTKKVAKAYFEFNGNGLDDLCKFLDIGKKAKGPGFDMWLGCMRGDKRSWQQMIKYNKHDVTLLEELYNRFLPWIENHPNVSKLVESDGCPSCQSRKVIKNGFRATTAQISQRWVCLSCNKHWLGPVKKVK